MGNGYHSIFKTAINPDPLQKKYNKLKQLHAACCLDLEEQRKKNFQLHNFIQQQRSEYEEKQEQLRSRIAELEAKGVALKNHSEETQIGVLKRNLSMALEDSIFEKKRADQVSDKYHKLKRKVQQTLEETS